MNPMVRPRPEELSGLESQPLGHATSTEALPQKPQPRARGESKREIAPQGRFLGISFLGVSFSPKHEEKLIPRNTPQGPTSPKHRENLSLGNLSLGTHPPKRARNYSSCAPRARNHSVPFRINTTLRYGLTQSPINRLCTFTTAPKPLETCDFDCFWTPLGVPEPLETWQQPLCQIFTLGDALGGELWRFLCFTSALKFQIKKRSAPIIKFRLVRHEVFRLVRHEGSEYRRWVGRPQRNYGQAIWKEQIYAQPSSGMITPTHSVLAHKYMHPCSVRVYTWIRASVQRGSRAYQCLEFTPPLVVILDGGGDPRVQGEKFCCHFRGGKEVSGSKGVL